MSSQSSKPETGIVYTFYSFKGGVGRTMALANVAALLAKWGRSVLVVDWDLEAPGLERFFVPDDERAERLRASKPGIADLLSDAARDRKSDWRDCVHKIDINGGAVQLSMISAGLGGDDYIARVQSLNFAELFDKHDLGARIEQFRNDWISEFEFVLIDSRTGVTDIGGICTVQLADILVLLFTTTDSSTKGAIQIVERARKARERLPVDRRRLIALPLPARDESYTEYERAMRWRSQFAKEFGDFYRDWLPAGIPAGTAVETLRIPYFPYWSFGERLPVLEEGTSDPTSLGYAYEVVARVISTRLDWYAAMEGKTMPPLPSRRTIDSVWLEKHRRDAFAAFWGHGRTGFMEIVHFCMDSPLNRSQSELLAAARQAMVHASGWPIGVVLDGQEERPHPTNTGIVATLRHERLFGMFDYWALEKNGDFYTLMSLFEDDDKEAKIYFDTRILRTVEALQHCVNLYEVLGADANATIQFAVRYGGLKGRTLTSARPEIATGLFSTGRKENLLEDEVAATISFRLGSFNAEATRLVKELCEPLFVVFDFSQFPDEAYESRVSDFLKGKILR